jgi:hypothetical protein
VSEREQPACVYNIQYVILCVLLGGGDAGSRRGNTRLEKDVVCSFFPAEWYVKRLHFIGGA